MSDINVDDFCKDAARAVSLLYEVFPRPHTLFVEDLIGPDRVDEFGMHSTRHLACFSALTWLAEEGLMRHGATLRQEALEQAVLSARAFVLLTTPAPQPPGGPPGAEDLPPSVRLEQSTRIHRLRAALAERSSPRIRAAVLDVLTAMQRRSD